MKSCDLWTPDVRTRIRTVPFRLCRVHDGQSLPFACER